MVDILAFAIALRERAAETPLLLEEARMIESMGVKIETGVEFGKDRSLAELQKQFDSVVLSAGLGRTPALGIEGEEAIIDGLEFIEGSKTDAASLNVGRNVIVIGAGNTAVDCATIAKRLGAERVTMVYRRTDREMTCYEHEYDFARKEGIEFRFRSQPARVDDVENPGAGGARESQAYRVGASGCFRPALPCRCRWLGVCLGCRSNCEGGGTGKAVTRGPAGP